MHCLRGLILLGVAMLVVTGCDKRRFGEVYGVVTFDGEDVEDGAIDFFPEDGNGQPGGGVIKNGEYFAKVPVGPTVVKIKVAKEYARKALYSNTPDSKTIPLKKNVAPAKYNEQTELRYEVTPGRQEKDWELTSK